MGRLLSIVIKGSPVPSNIAARLKPLGLSKGHIDSLVEQSKVFASALQLPRYKDSVNNLFLTNPECERYFFARIGATSQATMEGRLDGLHTAVIDIFKKKNLTLGLVADIGIGALNAEVDKIAITTRALAGKLGAAFPDIKLVGVDQDISILKMCLDHGLITDPSFLQPNLSFAEGDLTKSLPFEAESVDLVFCTNVFMYFNDKQKGDAEGSIARILKPGTGIAVIGDGTVTKPDGNLANFKMFVTRDGWSLEWFGNVYQEYSGFAGYL